MSAFRKINITISAANKSKKKIANWEKWVKNQLNRTAVSNIKWFDS